jgi:hypothetical protein
MNVVEEKDNPGGKVFSLQGNKKVAPFVEPVQETEDCQPVQAARQVKVGGMPGLEGNRQTQHEEYQSIDKIDDAVIDRNKIPDKFNHRIGL